MWDGILKSEYEELEPVKEKTLPEYYLAKANYYAEQGRDFWLVDGLTEEKRYFRKFDEETRKIGSAFFKLGLRQGDVVIYMIKDLIKVSILLNGVWRANGKLRATYPDDHPDTILFRVKESNVKFIVCEEELVDVCKSVSDKVPVNVNIITVRRNKLGLLSLDQFLEEDNGSDLPELLITENDTAVILCTSGTSGLPKGAVHTHGNLLYQARSLERLPFSINKPTWLSVDATHSGGTTLLLPLMARGRTGVVVSNVNRENIFTTIAKYKPGLTIFLTAFAAGMAGPDGERYDLSSVEMVLIGGSHIAPALKKAFLSLPNVKDCVAGYGLTECGMCVSNAVLKEADQGETPSLRDSPDLAVGKVIPGTKLQIRDTNTMEVLGPNQQGEVCIWSKGLFHSYLNNPKATQEAHVDGYFRTGDIGYFDENGFVYIVGRLKEIFKHHGNHIPPTEIESVLGNHPKVLEACVIGVEDAGGHIPRAFVTIRPGFGEGKDVAEDIKQFANANLASYKHLRGGVYIVDELPKGKTGKITRQLVEKLPLPF